MQVAHLLPRPLEGRNWAILNAPHAGALDLDFAGLVASLEEELARVEAAGEGSGRERAILIGVSGRSRAAAEDSMAELAELARSAGLEVADTIIQRRPRFDPRFLMGKGRLSELVVQALQLGADLLVFDAELSPSQVRSITDFTELKVIDRTQLILDLFAQRARSREGKLQVEMAQVKYLLPRLVGRGDALSRLMGGIGGRGPGESKLEMDRRRLRDRLHRLNQELAGVRDERRERRQPRRRQRLPVLSIIGYTNAGKSTLFNALTHASGAFRGPALRHPGPHQPAAALPPGTGGDHHRYGGLHQEPPQEPVGGLQGHPGGTGGGRPPHPRGGPQQSPFHGADGHGG